jgi:hypothetical protein
VPPRRYTEQQFRAAVADTEIRTLADLCRALGIVPRGANYETVKRYAASLGVDLTLIAPSQRPHHHIDRSALADVVASASSLAGVLRGLGLPITDSLYRRVRREIVTQGLSTDHFVGQGWSRGRTFPEKRKPLDGYLRRGVRRECMAEGATHRGRPPGGEVRPLSAQSVARRGDPPRARSHRR